MREIPDCLSRRYRAVDDLIQELSTVMSSGRDPMTPSTEDPGIKLMCEFWNILKEEPDLNLPQAVQQRIDLTTASSSYFRPKHVACYMASSAKKNDDKKMEALNKIKRLCCKHSGENTDAKTKGCPSKASASAASTAPPLNKVLCNLKEAASFDKKCNAKISELMATQKGLQAQIQHLEQREKEGISLLKEADCMWSCMEESYKKKVAESLQRQKGLLKQLKDAEANNMKWRKNRKDLEFQINNISKCHQEITERINQKSSDIKCIDMEIETFRNRIESNKNDLEISKKSVVTRKQASDNKIASIANEVSKLEKKLKEEQKFKKDKEIEGSNYIKEAREDLQKLCKVLLQKRLENEDFRAEREALLLEIELLKQTCDQCKDKCKNKEQTIQDEIKRIEKEIEEFKVKCIQCHECTDTIDVRKFCSDCPRCIEERNCHLDGDHCTPDYNMDCVCMTVKERFLDNVFDNMYTVLERQIKSGAGKAVADTVLNCLKKSRNGKLNEETRKILQEFILTTVKKNLNLTIVGGAVKTRCEMDAETYEQLMLCLKQVKVTKPPKTDKGTDSKKDPCRRWGGTSECNCPKGPKSCVCTKKAPAPPSDPNPCPEPPSDKEDLGEVIQCPHKESTSCGPDCAMHAVPSSVGTDVASWRPNPCQGATCQFKNMRAAQCVLGPEALSSLSNSRAFTSTTPYVPGSSILADRISCKCGALPTTPCACHRDNRSRPRQRIIEEVMGRYTDVTPIEKVSKVDEQDNLRASNRERKKYGVYGSKYKGSKNLIESHIKRYEPFQFCSCMNNNLFSKKKYRLKPKNKATSTRQSSFNINKNVYNEKFVDDEIKLSKGKHITILETQKESSLNKTHFPRTVITVDDLVKDIIVPQESGLIYEDVEWVSLETLIKQVTTLTRITSSESNTTLNEVEINKPFYAKSLEKLTKGTDLTEESNKQHMIRDIYSNSLFNNHISKDFFIHAKQLKVGPNNTCDQSTCKLVESPNNVGRYNKTISDRQNVSDNLYDTKYVENKAEKPFDTNSIEGLRKCIVEDMLKVTLESDVWLLEDKTPIISKSSSGNLEMAINKKLFELIDRRTKEEPNLNVFLVKTDSGHVVVDFKLGEKTPLNGKRLLINRTVSGSLLLQMNNNIIRKPSSLYEVKKSGVTCCGKNEKYSQSDITKFLLENTSKSSCKKENNNMTVPNIKIKFENDTLKDISGNLIRTSSGNVAIIVEDISKINKTALDTKEQQHLLIKRESTTVVATCKNEQSDAKPKLADHKLCPNKNIPTINEYFPVQLKGILCPYTVESLMVVRTTNSGNYEIVFNKEFEKIFKETIKEHEGDDKESYIKLKSDCDQCIIDFDDSEDHQCNKCSKSALLVKSPSGTIKLLIKNSDRESLKRFTESKSILSRKIFEGIFKQLSSSDDIYKNKLKKTGNMSTKSSSDSNLYEKVKFDFINQQNLLTEPPAVLKKSKSGQFEIILNKESKKNFVNNLKNYLSNNSKVRIPVKRSKSGQITINLGHNANNKEEYGSLKITPSGNIYVSVDESKFCFEKKPSLTANQIEIQEKPSQYIYQIKNPASQAISTTCNAKLNDSSCDTSKCVCKSISYKSRKWFIERDDSVEPFKSEECLKKGIHFVNNFMSCESNKRNVKYSNTYDADKKSPHIVIKPCGCRPLLETYPNKGCYRFVQSVCPYHINRYENVSNELLEISGPCSRGRNKFLGDAGLYVETNSLNLFKHEQKKVATWDSLEYLPPQLPPFLRDYEH